MADDVLDRIDETLLTYYSAGLGAELAVPVEKDDEDPAAQAYRLFGEALAALAPAMIETLSKLAAHLATVVGPALRRLAIAAAPLVEQPVPTRAERRARRRELRIYIRTYRRHRAQTC